MNRTNINELALISSSKNAQHAIDVILDENYSHVPEEEKAAWAMSALIHCDICRVVVAYDEAEIEGVARLLWLADITSKLYEAKNWYFKIGAKLLLNIAKSKSISEVSVRQRIKEMKLKYTISEIEKYEKYRNKVGYHYDSDALAILAEFGNQSSDEFNLLLMKFVKFSGAWAKLTSEIIQNKIS